MQTSLRQNSTSRFAQAVTYFNNLRLGVLLEAQGHKKLWEIIQLKNLWTCWSCFVTPLTCCYKEFVNLSIALPWVLILNNHIMEDSGQDPVVELFS